MEATKEKKFTPGPWNKPKKSEGGMWITVDATGDGWNRLSVVIYSADCDSDTAMANVRLIAASPEAYDLALAVAEHFKDTDAPLGKMARDYLKLAEEGRAS